jgi:hypothetical protein
MIYVFSLVARFVIFNFSSVQHLEGNVIGCLKWKAITDYYYYKLLQNRTVSVLLLLYCVIQQ